jgi:serine/threonine protein kinase
MGEVYKARDTRLDRTVAIKTLPESLAAEPAFRERFDREARAISQLDHPHICALYDVGEVRGTAFLVMQYLEGETLANRLQKGGLSLDQALRYGVEIADALHKAHRAGIVHRDLKPGNVFLTSAGTKLLDFGLARMGAPVDATPAQSIPSTTAADLTAKGTFLGTFQYTAPEQLEGHDVDARADIFAFGAVLYEMVTGAKAFQGETHASLIGAIMQRDPPSIATLRPDAPPFLDHLVSRCLAKDRDERWQTASDVMRELKWIASSRSELSRPGSAAPQAPVGSWRRATYALSLIAVSLLAVVGYLIVKPVAAHHVAEPREASIRVSVSPPPNTRFSYVQLAFSPDGRSVAFIGLLGQRRQLWVYSLSAGESHMIADAEGAYFPFWSPDSENIGFFTDRALMRISASGGPPQNLAPAIGPNAFSTPGGTSSGAWSDDSIILFTGRDNPCIYRIPSGGGTPTAVTTLDSARDEVMHLHPRFLPGGQQFLYLVRSRKPEFTGVYVRSLEKNDSKLLIHTSTQAEYVAPGFLLFGRDSILLAQRFNLSLLILEGDPLPIAQRVNMNIDNGGAAVSASRDGSLVYFARADAPAALKWVDRQGKEPRLAGPPAVYRGVELSPDDRKALVRVRGPDVTMFGDAWMLDLSRSITSRLTVDAKILDARWSPDGEYVYFDSHRAGAAGIYRRRAGGTGREELIWPTDGLLADVSKRGSLLIQEGQACRIVELAGGPAAHTFIESPSLASCGRFTDDGDHVAYTDRESGRSEVYIVRFPEGTPRVPVSGAGGVEPRWRKDGRELFYLTLDGRMMSVAFAAGAAPQPSSPKELFQAVNWTSGGMPQYSVTKDGAQFLMIDPFEDPRAETLTVIAHWSDTLQK